MDHSIHFAALLGLYRNYKALTTNRDQLFLDCAAFGQMAEIAAQRVLNKPLLFFHVATDARQLRRGAVVECAIRRNFVAEEAQQRSEIGNPQ